MNIRNLSLLEIDWYNKEYRLFCFGTRTRYKASLLSFVKSDGNWYIDILFKTWFKI